ncbi:uncharacterized protein PGTG_08843 [Puccinia graminis f. sp. tritici CRL 75-36-700-3]|uniref:Rab proteins geranylgeranyltransferase component A n=1 Tax=Puccinia graminis f. sp. tritici (strain CRL 75-36-700-3 / race SCCL) TaxID=418459 RepID=E3KEB4_PUCGT|nr:uncharacterized protein PGTG_08843 [Puccinia graminis f. sp. tritici CRL 75-36-700-3]EFP82647.1 hypothetical protein PGTG_08843 [Puccinia graminis f. sp. tritici CRL 75-36-700-3]
MDEQQAEDGKDGKFDYLVIGTGLIESMVAHHLASSDSSTAVLQVDPNSFYGQSWAAVELDALQSGSYACTSSSSFTSAPGSTGPSSTSPVSQNKSSAYSLSLQPTLVPARGTFVDALVASNVAPYLSFQLLHAFILAQPDLSLLPLPGSKHDLFRMSQLSLLDKRLLMRFFQAILEPDRLLLPEPGQSLSDYLSRPPYMITNPRLVTVIGALSLSAVEDPAAGPVLGRLKTLLSAIGRHPSATLSALPAALLLGEYGGGGEWAEGFVRAAAVTGRATQVLGRPVLSLRQSIDGTQQRWIIRLGRQSGHPVGGEDHLEFSAGRLLVSQQYLSLLLPDISPPPTAYTISRAIAIVGRSGLDKLNQLGKVETAEPRGSHALVVFPPEEGCADRRPVHALIVGPDSGSCPEDEQIIYLSSIIPAPDPTFDPTQLLEPVLDRLLRSASSSAPQEVLRSSTFYSQCVPHLPPPSTTRSASWIVPSWPAEPERSGLAEVVEWAR